MRDEIRKRIEAVRRGEVPEGYRKSGPYIIPEDWGVERLGNLSECTSRPNRDGKERPVYSVNNRNGFVPQSEQFEEGSYQGLDKSAYKIVKRGEFAYNPARVNVGSIGRLRDAEEAAVSSLYVCVKTSNKLDGAFFDCWTKTPDFKKETLRNLEGSVREYLFFENFSNIRMPVPTIAEQQKIAEILSTCDREIELKQKFVEELQNLKKTCLTKMFPRKGSDVPEARFPRFTGPWEQRKLGDILQPLPFKPYLKVPEQNGRYEIIQQGNEPIIGYADGEPCKDYENTVIFGDHTLSLYKPKTPFFVATDGVRIVKGFENMDGKYLLPLLEKNKPQSEGYKRYYSILADRDVVFTANHEEQSKIGECFEYLDNLITLHQRELEAAQQKKKSLMQLLLTGLVRVSN